MNKSQDRWTIELGKDWFLRCEDLDLGPESAPMVLKRRSGWLKVDVPCDVHIPLIEKKVIKEPLEADNCYAAAWIENKSWWFKKSFRAGGELLGCDAVELVLESLDAEADIFLNGTHLAHHGSAFYPYRRNVKELLRSGCNTLLVRVTSGVEHYRDTDISKIADAVPTDEVDRILKRGEKRRPFVRKPQFVFGWDWAPRLASCGIMGAVRLEVYRAVAVRSVAVTTENISGRRAELRIEAEIENLSFCATRDATVRLIIRRGREKCAEETRRVWLRSGTNYITMNADIGNPELWWPNGLGAQPLYTLELTIESEGAHASCAPFRFGIRTLELDCEKTGAKERRFAFKVNGVRIFCKGANWIPADLIYARVSDDKYETLIREARDANFNMLRVWGGGNYERDIFYDKCDELGILIWQDFMFACAFYPDYEEWFRREAEREIDWQTRRLRNHPSLALWCGNNENHWAYDLIWRKKYPVFRGAVVYNEIAPRVVRRNCPNIPYWNSSPYGGTHPNDDTAGNKHHWYECMMNPAMEKRIEPFEFDKVRAKFVSEYGYIGPCAESSIRRYFGPRSIDRAGSIWRLHTNTCELDAVAAGIRKHYADQENLALNDYILYASLCQGTMLAYSLEAMRTKDACYGSLFWMYNDCWGETGWSIIDYYLKRKPSYYFVKRAFAPKKLILRERKGRILVMGINDTAKQASLTLEYGYVSFDGKDRNYRHTSVRLAPFSRSIILEFAKPDRDFLRGCCFARLVPANADILPGILRTHDFRRLFVPVAASLEATELAMDSGRAEFTVRSDVFAHAVHFELPGGTIVSDEYFDLLPGEKRRVVVLNACSGSLGELKPVSVLSKVGPIP